MARARTEGEPQAEAEAAEPEAQTPEEAAEQQAEDVAEAEQEMADAAEADEKRRAAMEAEKEDDADGPPSQKGSGDNASYSHERLIAESAAFTGHPSHVMAGALYGVEKPYLTADEATKLADDFLAKEV